MNKVFILRSLFFFIILIIIVSCKKDYEKTLNDYLKYLKKNDYKNAYDLLSTKDKDVLPYDYFSKDDEETPISKNISKRIIYKIIGSALSETRSVAKINVLVKRIDLKKAYLILPELLNESLSENEIDKIFKNNEKLLKGCYLSNYVEYKLVLEGDEWKISADFWKKKKVRMLLDEAKQYLNDSQYKLAMEKYASALDFENDNNEAVDNIMIIKEKQSYIQNFLKFSYEILKNERNETIIILHINNNGTIAVKKIFVDFFFYDKKGGVIFKERKEVSNSRDKRIGYKEEVKRVIIFKDVAEFYKVNCIISAIDF